MNNSDNITFSIIIPTFNRADIVSNAIKSILGQTYTNWELIVVDDGSTDNTEEVVNSFGDTRIKYFYKKNEERSIARNFGIDKATGEYISFLDDDDYYLPEFLSVFYEKILILSNPVCALMCYEYLENNGKRKKNLMPEELIDNPVRFLWKIQTSIRPFVIHRDILSEEKFKKECKYGQDFHLAIRIALKYTVVIIQEYLSVNRIHKSQGTNKKFVENRRQNAQLSIMCIDDLLEKYNDKLSEKIPANELYDLHNHKIYGFSSASLKQCDIKYFFELFRKLSFRASLSKSLYYGISLIVRFPYYYIKCIFQK